LDLKVNGINFKTNSIKRLHYYVCNLGRSKTGLLLETFLE